MQSFFKVKLLAHFNPLLSGGKLEAGPYFVNI
jgi:hypothetical protein